MSAVARLAPAPRAAEDERIGLVCRSGHETTHFRARVLRLDDGWCGECGIGYKLVPTA